VVLWGNALKEGLAGAQVWASGRETRCDRWSRSLVAESRANMAMTHRSAKDFTPEWFKMQTVLK